MSKVDRQFAVKSVGFAAALLLFYVATVVTGRAQMVAQYGFEGNVFDTSGNGLNGTNHGVTFTTGMIGAQAGVFNGSSYVDLGNNTTTGPLKPSLPVTISAWIYLNGSGTNQRIFASDNTDNSSIIAGYGFGVNSSNSLECFYGDAVGSGTSHLEEKTGNSVLTTGQWYHVAAVIVGASNMHLYVNGGDDGGAYSGSGGTMAYTTTSSKIGTSNTANFFNGNIDAVQVYNTALTDTQIELLSLGGLGSWAFSEGTGTTTADATGNGFTGTLVNSPTWTTGQVGNALTFNGVNNYVNLNNTSATNPLKPSLPITVGAWVKLSGGSAYQRIFTGDNTDNSSIIAGYGFAVNSSNVLECFYGDAGGSGTGHLREKTGTTVLQIGTWYYLSAVIQGPSNMTLYVNGVNDNGTYTGTGGAMAYTTASSKIGTSDTLDFLKGTVEDVCVYNFAFTPSQIAVLYSAQPSAPSLPTSFGDNFDGDTTGTSPPGFAVSSNINTGGGVDSWSVVNSSGTNNVYQAVLTNAPGNGSGSATSIAGVPYLGGGINRNFTYSTNLKVVTAPSQYNIAIVALSGPQSDLSGSYYRAGVNQSGGVFLQSSNGGTTGLTLGTATNLTGGLVAGTNYTFTITGTYSGSTLTLAFTVTDGTNTGSLSATTTTPLTGKYCGYEYEVVTIGGSLTVQADNFNTAIHFGAWTPVFDDEFTGTSLNTSLWSTGYRWAGVINSELEAMRPENVTVANGVCTIKAEQRTAENANMFNYTPDTVMNYASGCIQTFTKFRQQYGYFEARIKMPSATGCWPAFWMLPDRDGGVLTQTGDALDERVSIGNSVDGVSIPMGNEIDTVEYQSIWENPSTDTSESHCGYIWSYGSPAQDAASYALTANGFGPTTLSLDYPDTQFHTYGVHWFPGGYVFYLDSKAIFNATSSTNVSVAPEYLILNCALTTSNWLGTSATLAQINAALPGYMQIDYVRSWSEGP